MSEGGCVYCLDMLDGERFIQRETVCLLISTAQNDKNMLYIKNSGLPF